MLSNYSLLCNVNSNLFKSKKQKTRHLLKICVYSKINDVCFICSPLSLYDGVKMLELLADKIHLTTSSFINIR